MLAEANVTDADKLLTKEENQVPIISRGKCKRESLAQTLRLSRSHLRSVCVSMRYPALRPMLFLADRISACLRLDITCLSLRRSPDQGHLIIIT
jgi:hypothetical protein